MRTVITGGIIVSPDGESRADIVIDDDEIVAMLADATGVDADVSIDAQDLLVLPAAIDTLAPTPWQTPAALDNQRAAAAGGYAAFATVADTRPDESGSVQTLGLDAATWYPLRGGQVPNAQQLARLAETGVSGFIATLRPMSDRESGLTDAELYDVMKTLGRTNLPLVIRPQHPELSAADPTSEHLAVAIALRLAEDTGAWVHIQNLTLPSAMQMVVEARNRGVRATVTVAALSLVLAESDATRQMRPIMPFRSQDMIDELWPYILNESVDCIGTTPFAIAARQFGITADAQTALPLFWDEAVTRRGMSRSQAVRMLSTNAAHITGMYPGKGTIRVGGPGDICLLDPQTEWTVQSHDILDPTHWSPIDGRTIEGFVVRTLRRGSTVYDAEEHTDGEMLAAGSGRLLTRTA